ncbi:gamma-glutamylcyclotransferase family protein [Alicyclobacillus acidocaldarius]|uniref:AIG2 family protein n=1 Tax=Alicyclobacillus acidocaldarius subsp. acidocaldarius (strain ATCC 27009 / DSM 446 / BCRC 14685 / JCM 5260 / KCTC 1825 / NBRC 15652 / NCIMB 11725 / NRRL B-14509 / 104-IA) TaxID=521098 RepID=C8WVW0_ALIAD|nr:gamma-glutamylcyclotransferase family protein [Alicyclobacillus acidocaldarius]ACV58232.1 AIG2 family protein [Alicyclobacillus acidocaldarius subsp. acidocaldarius DSM 446]
MIYFAYGSCMNVRDFRRTCPTARMICEDAILFGHRLAFNGHSTHRNGGVANIVPARGHTVHGVLWYVPDREVKRLDRREGAPYVYRHLLVLVRCGGEWEEAETYFLAHPLPYEVAPSDEYARLILDGIVNQTYRRKVKQHIERLKEENAHGTAVTA